MRKATAIPALLLVLVLGEPASACLWYYGKNIHGHEVHLSGYETDPVTYVPNLLSHPEVDAIRNRTLGPEPAADADFRERSDYAATLLHRGEVKRAREILESIERSNPGEYVVAANLGTAWELSGDNDKALRWISEGMRRNPGSHYGTEWLHLRILEAKKALAKDPGWLSSHSVLGLDFGSDADPRLPTVWPSGQNLQTVIKALEYQLHERIAFVPAPDPVVGGLIADLGTLLGLTRTATHAVHLYRLAIKYQAPQADLLTRRLALATKVMDGQVTPPPAATAPAPAPAAKKPDEKKNPLVLWGIAGSVIVVVVGFVLGRRGS